MNVKILIIEKLKENFSESIEKIEEYRDDLSISINSEKLLQVCNFLKSDPELQFIMCKDITAIDWAKKDYRFEVVYHIYSFKLNYTLRLKTKIKDPDEGIESAYSVWQSANWYERETYDMYGIKFKNHPDLRRMYMPEYFEYYPLRKDFPLLGIPGSLPLPKK
jgi:NADH-quinone oxidoreductase subunit C